MVSDTARLQVGLAGKNVGFNVGHAIEEEFALQVIDLVLRDDRLESLQPARVPLAESILRLEMHARRAAHAACEIRNGQTSLALQHQPFHLIDLRIDQDQQPLA